MGRVSLTEDYDDRSVISKLNEMDKRVKENTTVVTAAEASAKQSAQAAQETADRFAGSVGAVVQNANAQINASKAQVDQAKAEVDETVTTVAQAVQTANQASASAQQSAQTVAGYEDRLSNVELRVTTAEGDIVTIQGRITALETADGQNVKLTGNASVYGRKAFNAISTRNVNGQGGATSCLELFRFKATSGQDHRFNFFRHLGSGVCLTFLRVQTRDATVTIIDGTKTPIGTSTGNITIGAGFTTDDWCVVYEKNESACVFCSLLSAFTGSRFPIKEANIDMSNQCNVVELTSLSGISEVTL